MKRSVIAVLLLGLHSLPTFAQDHLDFATAAMASYDQRQYAKSATAYLAAMRLEPTNWTYPYNAACSYALAGDKENAFKYLELAVATGQTPGRQLTADSDLKDLHEDQRWAPLVARGEQGAKDRVAKENATSFSIDYAPSVTESDKLAGLSRLVTEIRLSAKEKHIDWDAFHDSYLPKVRAATTTAAYYAVLADLCAQLESRSVRLTAPSEASKEALVEPAFRTRLIEGRIVVTEVFDPALHSQGLTPGAEVAIVNGIDALDYARKEYSRLTGSGTARHLDAMAGGQFFLMGPEGTAVRLMLVRADGKKAELTVERRALDPKRFKGTAKGSSYPYFLDHEIALMRPVGFGARTPSLLFDNSQLSKVRALIIDLRIYEGGYHEDGVPMLLKTLLQRPFQLPSEESGGYRGTARSLDDPVAPGGKPRTFTPSTLYQFAGPIYLLTSAATRGSAEVFIATLASAKRATVLGEATAGGNVGTVWIELPAGGYAHLDAGRIQFPENVKRDGHAIVPDIVIRPTVAEFRSGVDAVLNAAVAQARRDTKK